MMNLKYKNTLGSERTVEIEFITKAIKKYYPQSPLGNKSIVLDVGGIPSDADKMRSFYSFIDENKIDYRISDFRGGDYRGDFVSYDFKEQKFDMIMFLSSLEHFPQCTEGDRVFRSAEDIRGFQKALQILNSGGYILLTVPFGKQRWQKFHQNYSWAGIQELTAGSKIIESYTYRLVGSSADTFISGVWTLEDPLKMEDIIYTDRAYGAGCFVLQKTHI